MRSATAFAPASAGNACVGFDVLGFAFPVVGDLVTVERTQAEGGLSIEVAVTGDPRLPTEPGRNTASVAVRALLDRVGATGSYRVGVRKGIPVSAGMGGSAASAVAAVVAANELLSLPMEPVELLPFALEGEAAASGGYHADNVAPSLMGGLTATTPGPSPRLLSLPVPKNVECVWVHPHLRIDTRAARAALAPTVALPDFVEQTAHLTAFVDALHRNDVEQLRSCMRDVVVEPQRAHLVPGFREAQAAAMRAGAIACAISGSGPSVFAWVEEAAVDPVRQALQTELGREGTRTDTWTAPPGGRGAHVVETSP